MIYHYDSTNLETIITVSIVTINDQIGHDVKLNFKIVNI